MFCALRQRQWSLYHAPSQIILTVAHIHAQVDNPTQTVSRISPCCSLCGTVPTAPLIASLACGTSDIHPFTSDIQGHSNLPFTLAFSPSSSLPHTLAVADEDGHLSLLHTERSALSQLNERRERWLAHHNAIFDVSWDASTHTTLATASADQTVRLWDATTASPVNCYGGHSGSVKCVVSSAWMPGVWVSGGRDGHARVWDSRAPDGHVASVAVDAQQRKRHRRPTLSASSTVTAVAWLDDRQLCTATSSSACARLWDMRFLSKGKQRCLKVLGEDDRAGRQYGVSSVDVDDSGQHVLLSCTNHELVCYHRPTATRHCTYTSHKANFYTRARFSPDGRYIACGSLTGAITVYRHDRAGGVGRRGRSVIELHGHEDEVGCVGWSRGDEYVLASCSDDHTVRLWRANSAAKSELGEGNDRLEQDDKSELTVKEQTEAAVESERSEMMDDEKDESDKENEPQHSSLLPCTPPPRLSTPTSSSSITLSRSPSPLVSSPVFPPSTTSSREPLADITNAVVDTRPAKRLKQSSSTTNPLLAFFSPVDRSPASATLTSPASAATPSSGKSRRVDIQAMRGSSPTLLDFWTLATEQLEHKADMDTEY